MVLKWSSGRGLRRWGGPLKRLNPLEHTFRSADRVSPFNFTVFAQIETPISLEALRASVDRQCLRYPVLGPEPGNGDTVGPRKLEVPPS